MSLPNAVRYAHQLVSSYVTSGDLVIDATLGNGNDTSFLYNLVGSHGKVYGFDIQQSAITHTKRKLQEDHKEVPENCVLFLESHVWMEAMIPTEQHGHIRAIMFNLGYLPGEEHHITTQASSTKLALQSAVRLLSKQGLLTVVIYTGHPAGQEEAKMIEQWSSELSQEKFQVMRYQFINQINSPPYVIAIYKK